ncbi:hypothetical protein HPB49_013457 [Dermacentor silvarum]|uniref:Uncharacterized protein n=1 Tax=Dermacentor silvarum TaxID=543639 RepID=A0ACB8D5A5_DERSI|nr:hypothetical protein HPB49_013457 [Dermacentor silvarum]
MRLRTLSSTYVWLGLYCGRPRAPTWAARLRGEDSYKNLTHKFLLGAKWVSDNCRLDSAVTIVKLDDDVLVNVFALSSYLNSGVMALTGFHCNVVTGAVPFRTRNSKWLRLIVKRVSGNSCCGCQGTREFEAMRLLMPPPENFYTGAQPIPPQHNFSLTRTILSPFFHILRSYNTSG